jgi:hypothetical protein
MKPNALYIGSHGMGENICQIPAIRKASEKYNLCLTVPDNLVELFRAIPWVNHVYPWSEFDIKILNSTVFTNGMIDKFGYHLALSVYYDTLSGDKALLVPRHGVGDAMDYVSGMYVAVNGHEAYNNATAEDLIMRFVMPDGFEEPLTEFPQVALIQGSGEPVRQLPDDTFQMLQEGLMDREIPFYCQPSGTRDMKTLCRAIYNSELVITPDTGPLHLALALGKQVILLESRETAEQVIGRYNRKQVHVVSMAEPDCGRDCHTRTCRKDTVPLIRECGSDFTQPMPKPGYPLTISCWGRPAPCLHYSQEQCWEVAVLADRILDGQPAHTEAASVPPLGEVPWHHSA